MHARSCGTTCSVHRPPRPSAGPRAVCDSGLTRSGDHERWRHALGTTRTPVLEGPGARARQAGSSTGSALEARFGGTRIHAADLPGCTSNQKPGRRKAHRRDDRRWDFADRAAAGECGPGHRQNQWPDEETAGCRPPADRRGGAVGRSGIKYAPLLKHVGKAALQMAEEQPAQHEYGHRIARQHRELLPAGPARGQQAVAIGAHHP